MNTEPAAKRSNLTLWLILAACVLPVVLATATFYLWPPARQMNHGELIAPQPLPDWSMPDLEGRNTEWRKLRGRWTMVMADAGDCLPACREKLYKMRQVRLAQGKNMDRVQRVWIVTDQARPDPALLEDFRGTVVLRGAGVRLGDGLPASGPPEAHIWIVDPLGNTMMRYGPGADPSGIKKDLERLLRVSRIE